MTFTMWSFGHYLFLASPFILLVILQYVSKNFSYEQKRKVGLILSYIMITLLILRNIEIWYHGRSWTPEYFPFQVCHFANFVLLYAFLKESKVAFSLAFNLNLLAAFLSIVFADGLAHYSTILNFRGLAYIAGHALIVTTTLYAFINGFIVLKLKDYMNTLYAVLVLYVLSVPLNNMWIWIRNKPANYFYSLTYEGGTPLESLYYLNGGKVSTILGLEVNVSYFFAMILVGFTITFIFFYISQSIYKKTWNPFK